MPDYAGNSLYESEEEYDIEELTKELERDIRKESVQIYREKLNNSEEIEKYNKSKLEKINPIILKIKMKYSDLSELKERCSKLEKESKLVPENNVLKNMVDSEKEKYNEEIGKLIDEVDEILGGSELDKALSNDKMNSRIDHVSLLKILKGYRRILMEQVDVQKEVRKKTIAVLLASIESEFELGTGTEFIDFLKEDIKKYSKDIQKELKKYSSDKLKEVLLNLKLLTSVYGYDSHKINLEFISEEMKLIKSKLKKDKKLYDNKNKYLDELSEMLISDVKTILIEEVKSKLEKNIRQLKNEKQELESKLKEDRKLKEISDIRLWRTKIKKEINVLKVLKSNPKNKKDFNEELDDKIQKNLSKIVSLNKRLDELNGSSKKVFCDIGDIFGIINLGVKDINKNKDAKKIDRFLDDNLEDLTDNDLIGKAYESEMTDLEATIKHYNMSTRYNLKNDEKLSFEEFNTQLKYYQSKIMNNILEKELEQCEINLDNNLKESMKREKLENEISEDIQSEIGLDYKTDELLEDDYLSLKENLLQDEVNSPKIENEISEDIQSEIELDYKTDELLEDDYLSLKENLLQENMKSEELDYETSELMEDISDMKFEEEKSEEWTDYEYETDESLNDEHVNFDKNDVLILNDKNNIKEKNFQKYFPMSENEKKDVYIKLSDISSRLRNLEWRVQRIDEALENIKKKTKKYDKLSEEQEDNKEKILDEIGKYEIFKDLEKSIEKGKNASYQFLYT